jgi:hypothetical protein
MATRSVTVSISPQRDDAVMNNAPARIAGKGLKMDKIEEVERAFDEVEQAADRAGGCWSTATVKKMRLEADSIQLLAAELVDFVDRPDLSVSLKSVMVISQEAWEGLDRNLLSDEETEHLTVLDQVHLAAIRGLMDQSIKVEFAPGWVQEDSRLLKQARKIRNAIGFYEERLGEQVVFSPKMSVTKRVEQIHALQRKFNSFPWYIISNL